MGILKQGFIHFLLLIFVSVCSYGQLTTRQIENHVLAKDIVANTTTIKVLDPVDINFYQQYKYSVLVKLIYGKEARKDIIATSSTTITSGTQLSYGLTYSLQFIDQNGNVNPVTETGNELKILYKPSNIAASVTESYQLIDIPAGAWKGAVFKAGTISTGSTVTTETDVRVEVYLICNYLLRQGIGSFNGSVQYNSTKKELAWPYQYGASYYQVEWVHIDSESDLYTAGLNAEQYFESKEPVRVRVSTQHYSFDPMYSTGKVFVRVRGVWIYGGISNTQENVGTWANLSGPGYLTVSASANDSKNWQRICQFAEEGKTGQSVSYLDGTFRNRQSLSLIHSENSTLVSENKYDFEGRPVISIMPYPVAGLSLKYLSNENNFVNAANASDKKVYDNKYVTLADGTAPLLSASSGAEKYYSSSNSSTQINKDFIPRSNGFSYSQIQYLQDGTGRIARQSIPGDAFNLKYSEGHFVTNIYSDAKSIELYRLFGKNVGRASHYEKHLTIDQNGQASVSYTDQFSRVVATALVGETPSVKVSGVATNILLSDEDNGALPELLKVSLLDKNRYDASLKAFISTSTQENLVTTDYKLTYDLKGLLDGSSPGFSTCKACRYDLEITITDPAGKVVAGTPLLRPNLGPESLSCPVAGTDGTYNLSNVVDATFTFDQKGEYRIIKKLTLNQQAQEVLYAELKTSPLAPQFSPIKAAYEAKINYAECNLTCEDKALSANPTWDPASPSYIPGDYTVQISNWINTVCSAQQYLDQSQDDPCKSILTTIKSDCDENQSCLNGSGVTDYTRHPEYCHYTACQRETASRQFDLELASVKDWTQGGSPKNYIGNMVGLDPLFSLGEFGNTNYTVIRDAKDALVNRMNVYYVENASATPPKIITDDGINQTYTLQQFVALAEVHGGATAWNAVSADEQKVQKWQMYQSMYSSLKQKMLYDIKSNAASDLLINNPWKCAYLPDEVAIVQKPFFSENVNEIKNKGEQEAGNDCNGLCDLNAQAWLTELLAGGTCTTALNSTEENLVLGYLKSYCIDNCGASNPLGILISTHITEVRNNLFITTKPGYKALKNALTILDAKNCQLLNVSYYDPYTYGTPYTKTNPAYKVNQHTYDLVKATNALLAEARNPQNVIYSCPLPGDDLYLNKAYKKIALSNSYYYQYNILATNMKFSDDKFNYISFLDDRVQNFTLSNAYNTADAPFTFYINRGGATYDVTPANNEICLGGTCEYLNTNYGDDVEGFDKIVVSSRYHFVSYNSSTYTKIAKDKIYSISNPRYKSLPEYSHLEDGIEKTINFVEMDAILLDVNNKKYASVIYLPNFAFTSYYNPFVLDNTGDGCYDPLLGEPFDSARSVRLDFLDPISATTTITPVIGMVTCPGTVPSPGPKTLCTSEYSLPTPAGCRAQLLENADDLAQIEYESQMQDFYENYLTQHFKACFSNKVQESFTIEYDPKQYHFTLYYYDQAGNLTRTIPPEAVRLLTASSFDAKGIYNGTDMPPHVLSLATTYKYNSIGQVIYQLTPDGGRSDFFYNSKGQMRLSQNAKQSAASAGLVNKFSYSKYDAQGRGIEIGELQNYDKASAYFATIANRKDVLARLDNASFPDASLQLKDITQTIYDDGDPLTQANLRGRIAMSRTADINTLGSPFVTRTSYSYDIHGNVKKIMQEAIIGQVQTTCYTYDLLSGMAKQIDYQAGKADQISHKYYYDKDKRLKNVYTSRDNGLTWQEEVEYFYYLHGALARMEYGEKKVQGMDYAYTLQGFIKMANTPNTRTQLSLYQQTVNSNSLDIGNDGVDYTNAASTNRFVGQDEFAFAVGYYKDDYTPINASALMLGITANAQAGMQSGILANGLYNGNITWMITQMNSLGAKMNEQEGVNTYTDAYGVRATAYKYDQLNRLRAVRNYSNTAGTYALDQRWRASYTYDRNGNILTSRVGDDLTTAAANTLMDSLDYRYNSSGSRLVTNNRLLYVVERRGVTAATDDIENQTTGNYAYDAIGNLTKDVKEGITNIEWTAYGKVRSVTKGNGTKLEFAYDAAGNRVRKIKKSADVITDETTYIRDASGNVLATYYTQPSMTTYAVEYPIYGSSRIGARTDTLDKAAPQASIPVKPKYDYKAALTVYELSNHLGNVHAVIANHKGGIDTNGDGVADFYKTSVVSLSDYYSFGMNIRKRSCQDGKYRYGFNGKEKDKTEWNNGSIYDYGFRIYDPRIAKFLSVDPLTASYPWYTPYQFAGNKPIIAIDLDGLEEFIVLQLQQKDGSWESQVFLRLDNDDLVAVRGYLQKKIHGWIGGKEAYYKNYNTPCQHNCFTQASSTGTLVVYVFNNNRIWANFKQHGKIYASVWDVPDIVIYGSKGKDRTAGDIEMGSPNRNSGGRTITWEQAELKDILGASKLFKPVSAGDAVKGPWDDLIQETHGLAPGLNAKINSRDDNDIPSYWPTNVTGVFSSTPFNNAERASEYASNPWGATRYYMVDPANPEGVIWIDKPAGVNATQPYQNTDMKYYNPDGSLDTYYNSNLPIR